MDRTVIFIDGTYLNKLLERDFNRTRIDYHQLAEILAQGTPILRTYYYHCPPHQSTPPTEEELSRARSSEQFFAALRRLPRFQVRLGKLAFRGNDPEGRPIFIQKRVDIMLCVDMVLMALSGKVGRMVLLAGDSDFVPAVEVAKLQGVVVSLWHGPNRFGSGGTVHQELWDECDDRNELTLEMIQGIKR